MKKFILACVLIGIAYYLGTQQAPVPDLAFNITYQTTDCETPKIPASKEIVKKKTKPTKVFVSSPSVEADADDTYASDDNVREDEEYELEEEDFDVEACIEGIDKKRSPKGYRSAYVQCEYQGLKSENCSESNPDFKDCEDEQWALANYIFEEKHPEEVEDE